MDPLTSIVLVTNFIALADNVYRGVRFIRRSREDIRADQFHVRLITEKARYAEWKRRMGIESEEDTKSFLEQLPENARESLKIILAPMEKFFESSQELLKKYGIEKPALFERRLTLKDKWRRIDFQLVGERELTSFLDILNHCNNGILTLAPPAPGYYVSLSSNDPILETSQPTQRLQNREHVQFRQTESRLQQAQVSHAAGQDQTSSIWEDIASNQKDSRDTKVFRPVIELLFTTSLDVLHSTTVQYPTDKPSFEGVLHRLSLWGSGMFHGLITIDQVLNQRSDSVNLLRSNIAGTLAEIAITLEYALSILGEPSDSMLVLRLKRMFAIDEISRLPLQDEISENDQVSEDESSLPLLERCTQELSELIECLFWTLPTIEMVFKTVLARQIQNPALDEREMLLLKPESDISLSNVKSEPVKELLRVDLELIAAMRESLKDTKYVEHMKQKSTFDPKQLDKELSEGSAQVKYWTSKLAEDKHGMTEQTQTAMTLNLARIARVFNAGYKPPNPKNKPLDYEEIQDVIRRCTPFTSNDEANEEAMLWQRPVLGGDGNTILATLDVLKSSNLELRRLAGSRDPGMSYQKDFSLTEKKEREAHNEPFQSLEDTIPAIW